MSIVFLGGGGINYFFFFSKEPLTTKFGPRSIPHVMKTEVHSEM